MYGLYSWAFKPPSLPWYMVDSDLREGKYSIVGWNMLLCARTRAKEALVLSLGDFRIRGNCHLPACGPRKEIFSISRNARLSGSSARRRHTYQRKKLTLRHLWLVQSWIAQTLEIPNIFYSIMYLCPVNPWARHYLMSFFSVWFSSVNWCPVMCEVQEELYSWNTL